MSWSVSLIGTPSKVADALVSHSDTLQGQSKVEYDAAYPALVALVSQNFGNQGQLVKLSANGYGYASGDEQVSRNCAVTIESIYGVLQ